MDAVDWPLARGGDADAFERIYRRHHRAVFTYAAARSRDLGLAEEVCAETFTALWRQRDSVRLHDEGGLLPWLYTVARRLLPRMTPPSHTNVDELDTESELFDPVGEEVAIRDFVGHVERVISELPPDYQDIAVAVFRDGLNSTQAGARLGIPATTVRTRLRWLRTTLTSQLGSEDGAKEETHHDRS